MASFGEHCHASGLSPTNITDHILNITVTKGIMMELNATPGTPWQRIAELFDCNLNSLRGSVARVKDKYKLLKKSIRKPKGKALLDKFLQEKFVFPQRKAIQETVPAEPKCNGCQNLRNVLEDMEKRNAEKVKVMQNRIEGNEKRRREESRKARQRLAKLRKMVGPGKSSKDVQRQINRLQNSRKRWRSKYYELLRENKKLRKTVDDKSKALRRKTRQLQRIRVKLNTKLATRPKSKPKLHVHVEDNGGYIADLLDTIDELEGQIADLTQPLRTMEGRMYTPAIRNISYSLQDLGVAEHHVSEVLRVVSQELYSRKLHPLPSTATQARMASEMKALSRQQVKEAVNGESSLTMKYDGTTKGRLGHLAEVEIATTSATYLMGIHQQPGGRANDYVESITSSCRDVDSQLIHRIKNTMTDRCPTNAAVDNLLKEKVGHDINSFRCGMHPLESFAREANGILNKRDPPGDGRKDAASYQNSAESAAQALLRAADKLFNNAASGDKAALTTYLHDRGLPSNLPRWVGNRFGILFHNAALLYCSGDTILEFFTKVMRPQSNLQSVFVNAWSSCPSKNDLRCLGILHKTFADPWKALTGQDMPILELNDAYYKAKSTLCLWKESPERIYKDGLTVFGDPIREDACWAALTSIDTSDKDTVVKLLGEFVTGFIRVMDRQLGAQLPGGEYWEPSPQVLQESASCSSTNISGERNFALVGSVLHRAPNVGLAKVEGKVMFKGNKTRKWLEGKESKEKRRLVLEAMESGKELRQKDKGRHQEYVLAVRERVRDKQQKLSQKERERVEKIEEIMEHAVECGIWQTGKRDYIKNMSKTNACGLLKKQITFHTKILQRSSSKGNKLALSKCLPEELIELLDSMTPELDMDNFYIRTVNDPACIIGKEFVHRWEEGGVDSWFSGSVCNIVDGEIEIRYVNKSEPFFMTIAELLTDFFLNDIVMS